MLDDFFVRSVLAGIGVAVMAGPLGCFVIWRRMAYFGDTMAHSALLGIALALLLNVNAMAGVFTVAVMVALALLMLQSRKALSSDSLLGILSHSTLALGLVIVAFMSWVRVDLMGFLFGDILSVSRTDIWVVYAGALLVVVVLAVIWRPLLAGTVSGEIAEAEGVRPNQARLVFMVLMALVIALAMKIVGVLLITSLLIIPAATARQFSRSPEGMALLASVLGAMAVTCGLFGSLTLDTPSGPSIVVAALMIFLAGLLLPALAGRAGMGAGR